MKTPKIARALADLVGIARKETSPARIETALADARAQVEAATRDREAAETAYRDGLLDAPEAELERQLAEKGAATVRLDRAEALVAALVQRLAMAREAEARAARQAIHEDATAQCDAIRARLATEYRHHAGSLRALLRDLAAAECARERAGREASDFSAIPSPEAELRVLHGLPEDVVSVETIELWVVDGRTDPVPADRQADVRRYDERRDRGTLLLPGTAHHAAPTSGVNLHCTLRSFTRTRYREAVGDFGRDLLCRTVALPAFGPDDVTITSADPLRDYSGALVELAGELPAAEPFVRPVKERLELLPAVPRAEAEVVQLRGAA
ncbi:hypothetical protein MKL09_08825 [Methylobacterium sp. J-048]|uniref:hypothetical protein n=1 Tax=Methylobacterium sp. J-048 TaxID=2836635 RepID=UPI001FBAABCE|nr:hypothetical protein [Methylobacterium sp. J-048]MCJ2056657.1 hypothetical protein [Methylobacterium sp. J-048]